MQDGMGRLTITTPDGQVIDEAKIVKLIDKATNVPRS